MFTRTARWAVLFALSLSAGSSFADVWYANAANTSLQQDGRSWATAFSQLQPAIDAAHGAGGGEVWVAAGVYGEPRSYVLDGIETGALLLHEGVSMYGGFAGNEERRTIRDLARNVSVISGKTSRNGTNAYHVVFAPNGAAMDGFVIRDGFANGEGIMQSIGGGLMCGRGKVFLENCEFVYNKAKVAGAGLHLDSSDADIARCSFKWNEVLRPHNSARSGRFGGGIRAYRCPKVVIRRCSFVANYCTNNGGAVHAEESNTAVLDSTFERNRAGSQCGGLQVFRGSTAVSDCVFIENSSQKWVGALYIGMSSSSSVKSCRFERNTGALKGGALTFNHSTGATVSDCTFIGNRAEANDGAALLIEESTVAVNGSVFEDNFAPAGAAALLTKSSVTVDKSTFRRNHSSTFAYLDAANTFTLTNSKVDSSGANFMWLAHVSQPVMTLADGQRIYPEWKGNFDLGSNTPIPNSVAAVAVAQPSTPPAPAANEAISIKTESAEITVSGSNSVVYAVAAVMGMVIFVLIFAWVVVSQRRRQDLA